MDHVSRVEERSRPEQLRHDVALMRVLQYPAFTDYRVKIRLHELEHQINISVIFRRHHI